MTRESQALYYSRLAKPSGHHLAVHEPVLSAAACDRSGMANALRAPQQFGLDAAQNALPGVAVNAKGIVTAQPNTLLPIF